MHDPLTTTTLKQENRVFAGTGGVSHGNRHCRFQPAFRDMSTGRTELARFANGRPAPIHLLDGLPDEWVVEQDQAGHVRAVIHSVVSGFVRDGVFYTREQAAAAPH